MVTTQKIATLESGETGEIEGYLVGGATGRLKDIRDVTTITCDYQDCRHGDFNGRVKSVKSITLDSNEHLPRDFWKVLWLGNAKDERKSFCCRDCAVHYLQLNYVALKPPGEDNIIEFPGAHGSRHI